MQSPNNSGTRSSISITSSCYIGAIDPAGDAFKQKRISNSVTEKRSLRSQDGGLKPRSELSLYFPNYEQILNLKSVKKGSKILLTDDLGATEVLPYPVTGSKPGSLYEKNIASSSTLPQRNETLLVDSHEAQILEDSPLLSSVADNQTKDPLSDGLYFKAHKRIMRREKQLRNIEREGAQHEKMQLERILSALQGHDWLRVMGVSGVTEAEKRLYEPKRAYLMIEISTLLEKFKIWKEEEKRRKSEREQLASGKENVDEYAENDGQSISQQDDRVKEIARVEASSSSSKLIKSPVGDEGEDLPGFYDMDGWAAHQLHQEAMSVLFIKAQKSKPGSPADMTSSVSIDNAGQTAAALMLETSVPPFSRSNHQQKLSAKIQPMLPRVSAAWMYFDARSHQRLPKEEKEAKKRAKDCELMKKKHIIISKL
ncbi:hypothetical protein PRK78_003900 [Emydomyces testavorans]|uniref:Something about silencing protein 4 domain-containing protein n=1 Tax=Emydomyces testavorans TaxID=2070801 RepID=A0AAF0DIX8_9EURO|nr:hypothetical protein PRK78_003900 [Emydomyces testavorans]